MLWMGIIIGIFSFSFIFGFVWNLWPQRKDLLARIFGFAFLPFAYASFFIKLLFDYLVNSNKYIYVRFMPFGYNYYKILAKDFNKYIWITSPQEKYHIEILRHPIRANLVEEFVTGADNSGFTWEFIQKHFMPSWRV